MFSSVLSFAQNDDNGKPIDPSRIIKDLSSEILNLPSLKEPSKFKLPDFHIASSLKPGDRKIFNGVVYSLIEQDLNENDLLIPDILNDQQPNQKVLDALFSTDIRTQAQIILVANWLTDCFGKSLTISEKNELRKLSKIYINLFIKC